MGFVARLALVASFSTVASAQPARDELRATAMRPGDWGHNGDPRWFVSTLLDCGYLYLRPRVSIGWGRPHWRWIGVEGNPLFTGEGIGAYGGARIALREIDLRVGARYFSAFFHRFLEPRESFERIDLESGEGPMSRYLSLEADLTSVLPLFGGNLVAVVTATAVGLVPDRYWVFEEVAHVIVGSEDPYAIRGRLGYEIRFGHQGRAGITILGEVVLAGDRSNVIVRGGAAASLRLWPTVELRGTFIPVLASHDSLGAIGGEVFELGIRHRWATGTAMW